MQQVVSNMLDVANNTCLQSLQLVGDVDWAVALQHSTVQNPLGVGLMLGEHGVWPWFVWGTKAYDKRSYR